MSTARTIALRTAWILFGLSATAAIEWTGLRGLLGKTDAPAWVQAVASVVAIIAAAMLATLQSRRQFQDSIRLQEANLQKQTLRNAYAFVGLAETVDQCASATVSWVTMKEYIRNAQLNLYDQEFLLRALEAVERFPLQDLPTSNWIRAASMFTAKARQIIRHSNIAYSEIADQKRASDRSVQGVQVLREMVAETLVELQKLLREADPLSPKNDCCDAVDEH